MGVILHSFIEIDIGSRTPSFLEVDNIRVFNEAEFFVWREPGVLRRPLRWLYV